MHFHAHAQTARQSGKILVRDVRPTTKLLTMARSSRSQQKLAYSMIIMTVAVTVADCQSSLHVTSRWREDWHSATVVNSTLMVDTTIRLPGFDLHRRQWSLLNRFRTGQGHCNACHKKWGFTDNELCDCGEIQTMSHIVNFCPLTKFDGGLLRLHEADEAAVDWLTAYGS